MNECMCYIFYGILKSSKMLLFNKKCYFNCFWNIALVTFKFTDLGLTCQMPLEHFPWQWKEHSKSIALHTSWHVRHSIMLVALINFETVSNASCFVVLFLFFYLDMDLGQLNIKKSQVCLRGKFEVTSLHSAKLNGASSLLGHQQVQCGPKNSAFAHGKIHIFIKV